MPLPRVVLLDPRLPRPGGPGPAHQPSADRDVPAWRLTTL